MKKHLIAIMLLSLVGSPSIIGAIIIGNTEMDYIREIQNILPATYDGRAYTSSVKDQQSEGNCWNYMANGLLETSLMKKYGMIEIPQKNMQETMVFLEVIKMQGILIWLWLIGLEHI